MAAGDIVTGTRIICDSHRGTVRYVGNVGSFAGVWLGIEWDDVSRGKHNGSYEGCCYFSTAHPTSGSFVRPHKVHTGITCEEAIRSRYGHVDGDTAGVDKMNLAELRREIGAPFLEVVGFDKVNSQQSQFDALRIVCVARMGIVSSGNLDQFCPNITELDLSHNLIDSWQRVAEITCQLNSLNTLKLSENKLHVTRHPDQYMSAMSSVKHLILGRVNYTWDNIIECSKMWPQLLILQVPFNNITELETPNETLKNLQILDLEGNSLSSFSEVVKLGVLNRLHTLNLTNVGLTSVSFPDTAPTEKTNHFPSLRQLHLTENNITDWNTFSELDKLQRLIDLKIRDNPIMEKENMATGRQLIIARMGNLEMLNGAEVDAGERKGAEFDYIKKYGQLWYKHGGSSENPNKAVPSEFIKQHPRYMKLIALHGAPEELELRPQSTKLKNSLLLVNIVQDDNSDIVTRKIPESMTVGKLKQLVKMLLKNKCKGEVQLIYISAKNLRCEIPLENDSKELSFYSIENGDKICAKWM